MIHVTPFFTWKNEREKKKLCLFIQLFCRYILKNNWNDPICQTKQMIVVAANENIWQFKWKLDFRKFCTDHHEFHSFPILKPFLMRLVVILRNVKLYFSNDHANITKSPMWKFIQHKKCFLIWFQVSHWSYL